jgi:hypothetical protein
MRTGKLPSVQTPTAPIMPLTFKFKRAAAPTHTVNFTARPMWKDLANKIVEMFSIPVEKVGVAVLKEDQIVDVENDTDLRTYYDSLRDFSEVRFVGLAIMQR